MRPYLSAVLTLTVLALAILAAAWISGSVVAPPHTAEFWSAGAHGVPHG